jgi:hypothetical protein
MRRSVSYCVQVVAQVDTYSLVVFQSQNQKLNSLSSTMYDMPGHDTSIGSLLLTLEECSYMRTNVIKKIEFQVNTHLMHSTIFDDGI